MPSFGFKLKKGRTIMTPDELVAEIFKLQLERSPDSDPGDLTIEVQDDSSLVMVSQFRVISDKELAESDFTAVLEKVQGTPGNSIQNALENYLEAVKEGRQ